MAIAATKPDHAGPGFTPVAREAANANATIGINLAGLADWNTELPFADECPLARGHALYNGWTGAVWLRLKKGEARTFAIDRY